MASACKKNDARMYERLEAVLPLAHTAHTTNGTETQRVARLAGALQIGAILLECS